MPLSHIDRADFVKAIKSLGVDTAGLYEVQSDVHSITLKRRETRQAPNGKTHLIETTETIPFVGPNRLDI